jgi:Holliday junction resolvase RusA-like endonuclease
LILRAFLPVPGSWPKSKKAKALAGIITPTVKPDADNLAKSVCDALNGVAWVDDKQVIKLHVFKAYGVPRVEVEIWAEGEQA